MKKKMIEDIVKAPSVVLEKTVEVTQEIHTTITSHSVVRGGSEYLENIGPGIITGAADDDPAGIATYSQTGAKYGLSLLWMAAWTFPLMAVIQEMCARIALVTGRGLAANIKRHYSVKLLYLCATMLFIANTFNIGADLGAMAKTIQLVFPSFNFIVIVILSGVTGLLLQVFLSYQKYAKYLKWLCLALLSYVATGFIIHMNWHEVLIRGIIPNITFSRTQIVLIAAILGTTISPYLFFWETSQEVEEQIASGLTTVKSRQGTTPQEIRKMRFDVWSGTFLSNVVMFFIIAVCATTLFANGITNIDTANDAALALAPLAGPAAKFLFMLGIIGTGLLAIPVLAGSTAYAVAESFGWKEGLYRKLGKARAFYGIIIISIILGILMNLTGIDPIKALIWSGVANSVISPTILFFIVRMSRDKKIMGEHRTSAFGNIIGWSILVMMKLFSLAAIISLL